MRDAPEGRAATLPQETGFTPKKRMHMALLGIGERLRTAREARGLSLDDVEASIRVRRRYLEALEAETFHAIPGPAYVRGFLRTYALYLGLPAEELVAMYPSDRPDVSREFPVEVRITPGNPYSRLRAIVTGIAVVFGIGVLFLGVMLYGQIRQFAVTSPGAPRTGHPPAAPARPAPAQTSPTSPPTPAPSQSPSLAGPASPAGKTQQTAPPPVAPTTVPVPQPPPAARPVAPAPGAPASQVAPAPAAAPASPAPPAQLAAPAPPPPAAPAVAEPSVVFPGPLEVVVVATDRTWVRAIADGVTVYDGFVSPGERQAWGARRQIVIRVGNASVVEVTVNGLSLGKFGTSSDVAERTFTAGSPTSP